MELLSTVLVKTYRNGKNIFSVEKTSFENRKGECSYLIDHLNSSKLVPPAEVPASIVSRDDLLNIIREMSNLD
jgi:hypothetical protein